MQFTFNSLVYDVAVFENIEKVFLSLVNEVLADAEQKLMQLQTKLIPQHEHKEDAKFLQAALEINEDF